LLAVAFNGGLPLMTDFFGSHRAADRPTSGWFLAIMW
jgi:D-hexose-6-phosphate mutarotase